MKLTKQANEFLDIYAKEKLSIETEEKIASAIFKKFSEIFPNISTQSQSNKVELIDLWLKAHVDQYFTKVKKYDPDEWNKNTTVWIPVHDIVDITPEIQYLLNIPIVRRCNAIKQLSTAYTIFPGAKHTRDEHQLGTLFIMRKFCEHLIEEEEISNTDKITLEVAALIHDLAHPPLGHSLDSIKEFLVPSHIISYDRKIDKTLLEIYLTDEKSQLKGAIESINTINIDLLKSIFFRTDNYPPAYGDLLDSEIDADRMDYILRDGIHTGITKIVKIDNIIRHSHFCDLKSEGKKRISLAFDENIESSLLGFLNDRKNMYDQVYENDEKLILDEVIVHSIFCTLKINYGQSNNEITEKFLLLTDCELNEFLRLFSPSGIYNQINSQLNGKPLYSLINKYNLQDQFDFDFYRSLKIAVALYSKTAGFQYKIDDEIKFAKFCDIKCNIPSLEIPPILFSLPHYIPSDDELIQNYDREGTKKRGLKDLVIRKSDGSCGYFKDTSKTQKEKNISLNKFLLIGSKEYIQTNSVIEKFKEFMIDKYLPPEAKQH
ncbi:MAG: phosphohydrolase [Candidatus Methanoperedens nitroreducens]|uniref:Phosphohydrolase n=1 Tax=Candidatus Methanoperedens nitratireducens TaxID=1392998 RepID=A0A0P7ZDM9_9EURY|nr:HD domain-containing protein [Candidatus Methanoperedens sp. BLZ2]KAB2942181.1 MAG: HD domain-containing protein [Candidatus Methanoperedens sp.]KPQ42800.1 MAG: phosphohydrolase [Candidatus Methanoperedens sp. BLZ1]MBZ0173673.1 HD domain-containing protein [Candidatus Methanoperedens nitroreducens]MCX9076349.1 HD domain-containing protein [Candidatus Methanoperedens sp.]